MLGGVVVISNLRFCWKQTSKLGINCTNFLMLPSSLEPDNKQTCLTFIIQKLTSIISGSLLYLLTVCYIYYICLCISSSLIIFGTSGYDTAVPPAVALPYLPAPYLVPDAFILPATLPPHCHPVCYSFPCHQCHLHLLPYLCCLPFPSPYPNLQTTPPASGGCFVHTPFRYHHHHYHCLPPSQWSGHLQFILHTPHTSATHVLYYCQLNHDSTVSATCV